MSSLVHALFLLDLKPVTHSFNNFHQGFRYSVATFTYTASVLYSKIYFDITLSFFFSLSSLPQQNLMTRFKFFQRFTPRTFSVRISIYGNEKYSHSSLSCCKTYLNFSFSLLFRSKVSQRIIWKIFYGFLFYLRQKLVFFFFYLRLTSVYFS